MLNIINYQFSSVQSLSRVRLFATPWITARQASLSITNSRSSPRLTSIESVKPSSHLILCRPLLLLPPVPPSIRVFSKYHIASCYWRYPIYLFITHESFSTCEVVSSIFCFLLLLFFNMVFILLMLLDSVATTLKLPPSSKLKKHPNPYNSNKSYFFTLRF